jgi:hypothetical protein
MARTRVPIVEVTAPDGSKSLWGAHSVSYEKAVEAVVQKMPPGYMAELSVRRIPTGIDFDGAQPGDVFKLDLSPRCPLCEGNLRVTRTLQSTADKIIRLFECRCGERFWD